MVPISKDLDFFITIMEGVSFKQNYNDFTVIAAFYLEATIKISSGLFFISFRVSNIGEWKAISCRVHYCSKNNVYPHGHIHIKIASYLCFY